MDEVIKIFKEIQATSSKNEKQAIIIRNKDNELFKECLVFLLDSNVVTGLSKAKINKKIKDIPHYTTFEPTFEECIKYLEKNNTGTDLDIANIQSFIESQPEEHREFYEQMITKNLKIGCDDKTVNKAIPDLIPTWEVQLGSAYDKLKLKKNEYFYLSQKLNGNRCSFVKGKLVSRQGKEFKGFQHIIDDIHMAGLDDYFIDGELIGKNVNNVSDGENFRASTGIINSDADTKNEIKLVIFDMFPVEELNNKRSTENYSIRKSKLNELRDSISSKGLHNIEVVTMVYEGTDTIEIDKWLQYAVDNDWEGLMLNKCTPYVCKRTTDLIKIKRFYTMDLEVVEVLEGDGRLKGTLGALVVKFKDNTVNVGSGYSDEQRSYIWNNKDNMIGKIIEIKYKEITKDKKTELESLQFPVFVQIRNDKTEESYE